ncbi:MAG: Flp pilus assembly complex ATPase component TadA, partial [Victivallales bacterium]|nr:Flp pilus assembly complex ATPase component TadA [Victivallales bacterium]
MESMLGGDLLQVLQSQGVLTEEQADQVRRRVRRAQCTPAQAIFDLGFASQEAVYQALSKTTGLPFVILSETEISELATQKVPAKVALHFQFVPLHLERGTLRAAFANMPTMRERDNLRLVLGVRLDPVLATPKEIDNTLKKIYGLGAGQVLQLTKERRAEGIEADDALVDREEQDVTATAGTDDASIIKLVNEIIAEAIKLHTTDIHIEPFRDKVKLRYRIDGMLREIPTPPSMVELHEAIVSRIKIMARLNIAEKRLPHDGRIRLNVNGETSDLRVSIMPTRFGETICLRVLASSSIFIEMSKLGLNRFQTAVMGKLVSLPH